VSIPLRIAEPTGPYRRPLRRFQFSGGSPCPGGYHNASADIRAAWLYLSADARRKAAKLPAAS
jgi:hypothetical protein